MVFVVSSPYLSLFVTFLFCIGTEKVMSFSVCSAKQANYFLISSANFLMLKW